MRVKLTQSARRRRIGVARVIEAMNDAGEPTLIQATDEYDERLLFVGHDHTGLELEILAIEQPDRLLVIHVMPTEWRNR
ncbi:MAG: hypothetical protein ACRDMV_20115 [Streptosporangiales bacterium]